MYVAHSPAPTTAELPQQTNSNYPLPIKRLMDRFSLSPSLAATIAVLAQMGGR